MKTLGKAGNNFENVLWAITRPDGEYYLPDADGSMSCAHLKTELDKIDIALTYWLTKLGEDLNREERQFATEIVNVYRAKKQSYTNISLRNCTVVTETPAPAVPDVPTYDPGTAEPTEKKTNWLLIAGVGVGALLILRKKKGGGARKKKVSGVKGEDLLLIGIGGFLVYKMVSKNSGTSTPSTSAARKQQMISWMNAGPDTAASKAEFEQILNTMSAHEIDVTYNWVFYKISAADTQAIFEKYDIFT